MAIDFPIMVGGNSVIPGAGTRRQVIAPSGDINWNSNQSNREHPTSGSVTTGPFRITRATAPGGGTSNTITLEKNASSTAMAVTFGAADTDKTYNSTTISTVAGDTLVFESTVTGTPADSLYKWYLNQSSDYQQMYSGSFGNVSTSTNRYWGVQEGDNSSPASTADGVSQVVPTGGVFQNVQWTMNNTITSGSYTMTLVKNGVGTSLSFTIGTGVTSGSYSSNTASVADGDIVYWQCAPSSPSNGRSINMCCEFNPTNAGEGILLGGSNSNISATLYNNWYGLPGWDSTEANVSALAYNPGTLTFKKIRATLSAAPTSSNSRTAAFRVGGSSSSLAVTISGANTTGSTSTDVSVATGDLINVMHTSSGSPAASNMRYGLVYTTVGSAPPANTTNFFRMF